MVSVETARSMVAVRADMEKALTCGATIAPEVRIQIRTWLLMIQGWEVSEGGEW